MMKEMTNEYGLANYPGTFSQRGECIIDNVLHRLKSYLPLMTKFQAGGKLCME